MAQQTRKSTRSTKPATAKTIADPGPSVATGAGTLIVTGIGASAGGLQAATRMVKAIQPGGEIAFILVQHLDPAHKSLMVELLANQTPIPVHEAEDTMPLQAGHLYVIPPGRTLSVHAGMLQLSPLPRHRARLAFDHLLQSLAEEYGPRAMCVVLSGTGTDGTLGALAIRAKGGFVVAQHPAEAMHDGMPASAIAAGAVNLTLPAAGIAAALAERARQGTDPVAPTPAAAPSGLPAVVELLRARTLLDTSQYKQGTLQRRVERRMSMAGIRSHDMDRYLKLLGEDGQEASQLAKDLLIHVTSFFRDPDVFAELARSVIPDLVEQHPLGRPLRVWVAGCSTGEETYSIAMLFLEQIALSKRLVKLQIFASDIDPDAIATAREGLYPGTIGDHVSPERLGRFFLWEDGSFRVSADLRGTIVFTDQDVLTDPPFSRLDMVSCRNLLIYLQPAAQSRVLSLFHFALRENGCLLLGTAETAGGGGQFRPIVKGARIYRRVERAAPPAANAPAMAAARAAMPAMPTAPGRPASRPASLGELGRRLVMEAYAPAAILVNAGNEVVFALGPTDGFLRTPNGHPTQDVLALTRPRLRVQMAAALQEARTTGAKAIAAGPAAGAQPAVDVVARPVTEAGETLTLVCFVERARTTPGTPAEGAAAVILPPNTAALERELERTRSELEGAVRELERSGEEQKAISEEALSANEEYQSTYEELLASKEELQSLNEELTAMNSQLQETLERQRTTSNDLQNVLYSTNIATLFLDLDRRIRFFTPATRSLFAVIASDIGRPLSDLAAMAPDTALDEDVRAVLSTPEPREREIEAKDGTWFRRMVLPYRALTGQVEGVVITFNDISARKASARALLAAKQEADAANTAKSRFLAAASHDLRQPLQTLVLLQALLSRGAEGDRARTLATRMDDTLGVMAEMLDALLDLNEIEAGVLRPVLTDLPIAGLLQRMRNEFTAQAEAKGITLRVAPCSASVRSDPRLLEQMVRNLVANAVKYTPAGKVLLGCQRRGGVLRIAVLDTGIGIADGAQEMIFEEYRQVGNAARERSRGLGLGLSIVKRLEALLDHPLAVHSRLGHGSRFTIDVPLAPASIASAAIATASAASPPQPEMPGAPPVRAAPASILVIDDDPDVRTLLVQLLEGEGHRLTAAADGPSALDILARAKPDLVLADYNLPGGMNGLQLAQSIRQTLDRAVPTVILTGDVTLATLRDVTQAGFRHLNKPVTTPALLEALGQLLPSVAPGPDDPAASSF